jgi:phage-related protein
VASVIGKTLVKAVQAVRPVLSKLATLFSTVFSKVVSIVGKAINKLKPIFAVIAKIVRPILDVVIKIFGNAFKTIGNVVKIAVGFLGDIFGSIMDIFGGLIDFVTGVFTGDWKKAWNGIVDIFKGIFNLIPAAVEAVINGAISLINGIIGGINSLTDKVGIPSIPEIPKAELPRLAVGTDNWRGGIVQVHEHGGEIMDLPKGTRVYPHDKSVAMARDEGRRSKQEGNKTISINITKLADKIEVRSDSDIDKIVDKLAKRLEKTALNMGTT